MHLSGHQRHKSMGCLCLKAEIYNFSKDFLFQSVTWKACDIYCESYYNLKNIYLVYLDQMYHGILKEDHVHASTPNALIVMAQEHVKTVL